MLHVQSPPNGTAREDTEHPSRGAGGRTEAEVRCLAGPCIADSRSYLVIVIANKPALDAWLHKRRLSGLTCCGIKGPPPEGMTYTDGDPVIRPVNIAWVDETGERIDIIYEEKS